jgi:hypothetical protein
MSKTTKQLAQAKGARTEMDFALFVNLVNLRRQLKKQLAEMMEVSPGDLWLRGIWLLYDFFLKRGVFFRPQPLPKGYRLGKAKECYGNSYKLAMRKEGLTYCEGFAVVGLGGRKITDIKHGWCATPEGSVIDVTLRKHGLAYFGVPYTPLEMAGANFVPISDEIIDARLS